MHSVDLPFLGDAEPRYIDLCINDSYNVVSEVEGKIISRAEEEEKNRTTNDDEDEKLYEIQHSYINFQPTIWKMKIDKLIGRSASKIKDTDYLFKVPNDPTKVTGIGELMIADLLTRKSQQGDLTFYD